MVAAVPDPATLEREPLRPLVWASAAFAAGVVLHLDRVPAWVPAAALVLVAWRLAAAVRPIGLARSAVRTLLAVVLIGAVFARFRTLNGLSAGTALLILMAAVKLLETRRPRDQYVVVGAGLFLLLAACLDRQSLARAPLYLLHAWLCCSALAVVACSHHEADVLERDDDQDRPQDQRDDAEHIRLSHSARGLQTFPKRIKRTCSDVSKNDADSAEH